MYVDDILAISCDAQAILQDVVEGKFRFKNDKIKTPELYLGAKLQQKSINGLTCRTITSQDYIKTAVKNVEDAIKGTSRRLLTRATPPMSNNYTPELDVTEELDEKDTTLFQELIGVLRWANEIG